MSREEAHVVDALVDLCRSMRIKWVLQVGSEDGYESYAIQKATGCEATTVDADPHCTVRAMARDHYEALIGATDCGSQPFYQHLTAGLSSMIQRQDGAETRIEVPQYRLDSFCAMHSIRPDALIIDVEGATQDVLDGCGDLLDGVRLIYAECCKHEIRPGVRTAAETEAFLAARGFTQRPGLPAYDGGSQSNLVYIRESDEA